MKGRLRGAVATVLLGLAVLAGAATPAQAAESAPAPAAGEVWFGPELDWDADAPDGYEDRLDETPAFYAIRLSYPLDERALGQWQNAAIRSAAQGAALVISLEPTAVLEELTVDDADALNGELERLRSAYDTHHLVRFGAEMNGSWTGWGQQPDAYVAAFERVAEAVHAGASGAEMVWAPSYGAGYPFERANGRLDGLTPRDVATLDTDDDGLLTERDDPYGPYYPDDDAVDRVGLTMFYFGKGEVAAAAGEDVPLEANTAPGADEVAGRLAERWGYNSPQARPFYERFAEGESLPMMLDTGSLYDPALGGDTALAVKQGWWRQVLATLSDHPRIDAVSWLETERVEAEAGAEEVDWRATADPELADALRADLDATGVVRWGPITERVTPDQGNTATVQVREGGDEIDWITGSAGVLAIAFLAAGVVGRLLPKWRYPDDSSTRDLRIDMLRGFIIIAVVITHIEVASPYSFVVLNAVGAITGAELFVMLSGIVLGMVYPLAVQRAGEWRAAVVAWGRARKQYIVALTVILLIFILGFLPFVDTDTITTFTDRGTGGGGETASGRVYDLYPNADRLLDYPPPWYAVRQFLLLEMGPWPFNIMGLFVALSLAVPALMWLIRRRLWWVVLAASWTLYALQYFVPALAPVPSQFNAVFPLLIWQVLFTHGLVLGYHRRQVIGALTTRVGKITAGLFVVGYAGFLAYLWAGFQFGFTPVPFPADLYDSLYLGGYQRIDLQWGRLLDIALVLIASYAVLTTAWKPLNKLMGWLWIPLGQASLYIFIVHVFFVLAVANIPGLDRQAVWQGTLVHTAVIAAVWFMVRRKFLFRVIPR